MNRNRTPAGRRRCLRCGSEDGHNAAGCETNPIPLWWRAILSRIKGPGACFWGSARKHERAKVGDSFGSWTVIELLQPDYTANERVRVRCTHGLEKDAYVFNLRKSAANGQACRHAAWRLPERAAQ